MRTAWMGGLVLSLAWGCSGGDRAPGDETGGAGGEAPESPESSGGEPSGTGGGDDDFAACKAGCAQTLEADCENGPDREGECVADCQELLAGVCGTEYRALHACSEGQPVTCGDGGIPVVEACSAEQSTFIDCLNAD
jgi:hypothetical protein